MKIERDPSLRILAFFAHPDDETMFLGGTLAFLADRGAEIHFLCATRGEGGDMGDPPICFRGELGAVREAEMECAVKSLGGRALYFLDYQDPLVGPEGELYPYADDNAKLIAEVRSWIDEIEPEIIITHGPEGEYGHPAHIQSHQSLIDALLHTSHQPSAVYAPAWLSRETGVFTPVPEIVVETEPWLERKIEAAFCHRTQHGLFLRHGSARAGRQVTIPEMIRSQEALCRIIPENDLPEEDRLASWLSEISIPFA
jgi:LmbE family N-acetylglucosaminyl deacetylase